MQKDPEYCDGTMKRDKVFMYPPYIDSTIDRFHGRKLAKEECVEGPTTAEISRAVCDLQLVGIYSDMKRYPRTFWRPGRLSITLWTIDSETGEKTPIHPEIHTRKQLFKALAAQVKKNRETLPPDEVRRMRGEFMQKKAKNKNKRR